VSNAGTCGPCGCPLRSVKVSAPLLRGTSSSIIARLFVLFKTTRCSGKLPQRRAVQFTSWNTTAIRSVCVAGRKQRTAQRAQRVTSVHWKQDKSATRSNPRTNPTYLPETIKYSAGCERMRTAARPVVLLVRYTPCTWSRNKQTAHVCWRNDLYTLYCVWNQDGVLSVV
jgi:hypothetical protein